MNQKGTGTLATIATTTLIQLARNATANASSGTTQQNGKDHEKISYTIIASKIQGARC
jgi:hypothetical protein